jgi:transposase InsO family protein
MNPPQETEDTNRVRPHTVIDDHSRVAYAEIHGDETAATALGVLLRAVSWFAARGVAVERVVSDDGSAYRSHLWRHTYAGT